MIDIGIKGTPDTPAKMMINHPTTHLPVMVGKKQWYIEMTGKDSAPYKEKGRKFSRDKTLENMRLKDKDKSFMPSDDEMCEFLASVATGWYITDTKEKPIPFSKESVLDLYKQEAWIKTLVTVFLEDNASFFMSA